MVGSGGLPNEKDPWGPWPTPFPGSEGPNPAMSECVYTCSPGAHVGRGGHPQKAREHLVLDAGAALLPDPSPESPGSNHEMVVSTSPRRDLGSPAVTIPRAGSLKDPTAQAELSLTHRSQDMRKRGPRPRHWPPLRCPISARKSDISLSHQRPELPSAARRAPASQSSPTAHRGAHSITGDSSG